MNYSPFARKQRVLLDGFFGELFEFAIDHDRLLRFPSGPANKLAQKFGFAPPNGWTIHFALLYLKPADCQSLRADSGPSLHYGIAERQLLFFFKETAESRTHTCPGVPFRSLTLIPDTDPRAEPLI